jgi:hypothetical protein
MVEFIPILIPILLFSSPIWVAAIIVCIKDMQWRKYLNSIKVGDVFYDNYAIIYHLPENPFTNDYITYNYMVIRDIKKNNKGETWVKYDEYRKCKWGFCEDDFSFQGVKEADINDFVSTRSRLKDIGTKIKIN